MLQSKPTKVDNEAHSDMTQIIPLKLSHWRYQMTDLENISKIALKAHESKNKVSYSVSVDSYIFANHLENKIRSLNLIGKEVILSLSKRDIADNLHFGDSCKTDVKAIEKTISALSCISFYDEPPIFSVEANIGDNVEIHIYPHTYKTIKKITNRQNSCSTRITKEIYKNYIKPIKRSQHAHAVFMERLVCEQKKILETNSFVNHFNRTQTVLKRLQRIFNPAITHTAREILNSGEKKLKETFGADVFQQIHVLANSLVNSEDTKSFNKKISNISARNLFLPNPINTLYEWKANDVANDIDGFISTQRNLNDIAVKEK